MRYLFFLFLIVPIVEIMFLLKASDIIGAGWTILLVIGTAALGAALVKQQGISTLQSVQMKTAQGQVPAMEVAEGAAIMVAGALLLTPGFFTDAFGFACLIPPVRQMAIRYLFKNKVASVVSASNFSNSQAQGASQQNSHQQGNVIEGDYREKDD